MLVDPGWFVEGASSVNAVFKEFQLLGVEVFAIAEASARSIIEFGDEIGRLPDARKVAAELRSAAKARNAAEVCRVAAEIYNRESCVGGICWLINGRLGRASPSEGPEAVSAALGELANYVWSAWAGLKTLPPSESTVIFRGVELRPEALDSCRVTVGRSFV
jgi:hypothetical protein